MRKIIMYAVMGFLLLMAFFSFQTPSGEKGAWEWVNGSERSTLTFMDNYVVFTSYDKENRKFHYTWGGTYRLENGKLIAALQFHTREKDWVGTSKEWSIRISGDRMELPLEQTGQQWVKMDAGDAPLAGVWRISGRRQGEKMGEIPLQARRTLKILSGTRFQWAAINIETGEFFGTGGGKYTFRDGKYSEQIDFFSRDSSRVGATLSFDGKLENGEWHHSGLSSKGDPIYEVWSRLSSR